LVPDNRCIRLKDALVHLDRPEQENPPERLLSEAEPEHLLTAAEVAELFRVSSKTVGRWGRSGALPLYRTIGGHHRYRLSDVRAFLGLRTEEVGIDA
jgi:excisionase family DNA binding protein